MGQVRCGVTLRVHSTHLHSSCLAYHIRTVNNRTTQGRVNLSFALEFKCRPGRLFGTASLHKHSAHREHKLTVRKGLNPITCERSTWCMSWGKISPPSSLRTRRKHELTSQHRTVLNLHTHKHTSPWQGDNFKPITLPSGTLRREKGPLNAARHAQRLFE